MENFIVGLTDLHRRDHLAALRDPQQLAIDLIEYPEAVKAKLEESQTEFLKSMMSFIIFYVRHDMPITSWTPYP